MSRAYYLDYPTSLHQTNAGRPAMERCFASLAYRDLCRLTLKGCLSMRLADASFPEPTCVVASNPGVRASIIATMFYYIAIDAFKTTTELNGPILDLANEELVVFIGWLKSRQIPFPISASIPGPENVQRLTVHVQHWIGSMSPTDPRSRWFAQAIEQPPYAILRNDLIHFTGI